MLKTVFLYIMAAVYILTGLNHFWHPLPYLQMIDAFLPYPLAMIYIRGVAEIAGGIGLTIHATRRYAAFGIIFLLIAITPAHIYMLMNPQKWPNIPLWALWLRIPLQLLLMYLANLYTTQANADQVKKEKAAH